MKMQDDILVDLLDEKKIPVTFNITYSCDETKNLNVTVYNVNELWNFKRCEIYLLSSEETSLEGKELEAFEKAMIDEESERKPDLVSKEDVYEFSSKIPKERHIAGILFCVRLERYDEEDNKVLKYSALLKSWADIFPTIDFFIGGQYWFSVVQWKDEKGNIQCSLFDEKAQSEWLRTGTGGRVPLVRLEHMHILTKEEAETLTVFVPFGIVRKSVQNSETIVSGWLEDTFNELTNEGGTKMAIVLEPIAALIIAKASHGVAAFIPSPRENIEHAQANLDMFLDENLSALERVGGLCGFIGYSIVTVLDFVPAGAVAVKATKSGVNKITKAFAEAESKLQRSIDAAKKLKKTATPERAGKLEDLIRQAEIDLSKMRAAKDEIVTKIGQVAEDIEKMKITPKQAAKRLRSILGVAGTKIWSGKCQANIEFWQRRVAEGSAEQIGKTTKVSGHFRDKSVSEGLGGIEELFETSIDMNEAIRKEIREIAQNATEDVVGLALKDAAKEMTGKTRVRIDHILINHAPDGNGGTVVITDYTGSLVWAHYAKSKLYEDVLRQELSKIVPNTAGQSYKFKVVEFYWRGG